MRKKNRICFCINTLRIGGAETLFVDLINSWDIENWEIYVFILSTENILDKKLKVEKICKLEAVSFSDNLQIIFQAFSFCRKYGIDLVNTHLDRANKWFALGGFLAGAKVVGTVHSIDVFETLGRGRRLVNLHLYNRIHTKLICVSDPVAEYLTNNKIRPEKLVTILNGIDISAVSRGISLYAPPEGILSIIFLGRLEDHKGVDILMDALALINSKTNKWTLDIIGDGSKKKQLEEKACALGIMNNICFHGMQAYPIEFLQGKSLLCMPSRKEGLPIALIEALSIGLPAIVSDVGFLPSIIKEGRNGYIFKKESPDDLARALFLFNALKGEQKLGMSAHAKESALKFHIKTCQKNYEILFSSILRPSIETSIDHQ